MNELGLVIVLFLTSEFLLLLGCSPWFAVLLGFFWSAVTFVESEIEP